ncbi:hypothetical protein R6Q59_016099 [Mikania micrantha]
MKMIKKISSLEMSPQIPTWTTCVKMIRIKCQCFRINNVVFKNISKDNQADRFAKFLKYQCDKDFTVMKPVKVRRFRHKYILDSINLEPLVYVKYQPPKTEKSVPVHMRVANDTLKDIQFSYFDEVTYGAVIVRDSEHMFILDPMDLLTFGRTNMPILF